MATRKKARTKTKKSRKKAKKKTAARQTAARKTRKTAAGRKKVASGKRPKTRSAKPKAAKPKAAIRPVRPPAAAAKPAATPGEERIGVVTHYYTHLSVAIIKLENGPLREGEVVHIKGHTSDFVQPVGSMEIDHVHVTTARPGETFGLRVKEHAREHDVVYRVKR